MAEVQGTIGADVLFGDANEDEFRFIFGHQGNDLLFGRPGQDVIFGGQGDDVLDSGVDPREGFDEGRTYTLNLFGNELFGGKGRDIGIIDGREDLWVGDTGPERFIDIAVIRNAHQTGAGTLVLGFDVRGKGGGNLVQDRFIFADSAGFAVESFETSVTAADPDGSGIVARLRAFTLLGDGGELAEFRVRWAEGGRPLLHADDESTEAIEAAIAVWTDQWSLDADHLPADVDVIL